MWTCLIPSQNGLLLPLHSLNCSSCYWRIGKMHVVNLCPSGQWGCGMSQGPDRSNPKPLSAIYNKTTLLHHWQLAVWLTVISCLYSPTKCKSHGNSDELYAGEQSNFPSAWCIPTMLVLKCNGSHWLCLDVCLCFQFYCPPQGYWSPGMSGLYVFLDSFYHQILAF